MNKQEAISEVTKYWNLLCNSYYDSNPIMVQELRRTPPTIRFSNRLKRTAGLAHWWNNYITLSNHFMAHERNYSETIGHEVAHVFIDRFTGKSNNHGVEWRNAMRCIGLSPDRCHSYESTKPRQRHDLVVIHCQNGCTYKITKNKRTRLENALRAGKIIPCTKCGGIVTNLLPAKIIKYPNLVSRVNGE